MGINSLRCGRIAQHNTPINFHHPTITSKMTSFLHKSKATILDHMKWMPDAHIADEEFITWGRQFINAAISRI
jgi:hypothetical protein